MTSRTSQIAPAGTAAGRRLSFPSIHSAMEMADGESDDEVPPKPAAEEAKPAAKAKGKKGKKGRE